MKLIVINWNSKICIYLNSVSCIKLSFKYSVINKLSKGNRIKKLIVRDWIKLLSLAFTKGYVWGILLLKGFFVLISVSRNDSTRTGRKWNCDTFAVGGNI